MRMGRHDTITILPVTLPNVTYSRHAAGIKGSDYGVAGVFDVSSASRGHLRRQSSQPSLTAHINIPVTP